MGNKFVWQSKQTWPNFLQFLKKNPDQKIIKTVLSAFNYILNKRKYSRDLKSLIQNFAQISSMQVLKYISTNSNNKRNI